jgi:spore coat protein CotH
MPSRINRTLLVALSALGSVVGTAQAQSTADLFDPSAVHEVRLFISPRDLQQLHEHYREDTYYTADFQWRDIRMRNIGLRSRGAASRDPNKPGLRIDFNRYTTGQQFLGLKSLVLDNLWQHGSMVAESVSMAFFTKMGQPAPRESYCRLYINDVFHGVYAIVESVDTDFLARTIGDSSAHLFSYQLHPEQFRGEDLGDDLSQYQRLFQAQTHELEADTILYSPIRNLFREVNQPQDAVWRSRVEEYLDLSQFVTHAAIENFLAELDGVLGYSGMNNFYLTRPSGSTRHRLLPWDKDSTFDSVTFPIMSRVDENEIFRRAMTYSDLRTLYLDVLTSSARTAAEDQWLESEITRQARLIAVDVREDTLKQFSNEAFEQSVAGLVLFARERPRFVLREVAKLRQTP